METQEVKELKRCIKKLKAKLRSYERKLENNECYIKELEDIEDNRLILYLRDIKNDEILDFNYSCERTQNNGKFEDSLTYNIYLKRKYKGEEKC